MLYLLGHGWALLKPEAARSFLSSFPRNIILGEILLGVAIIWFAWVLSVVPLMEYEPHRGKFVVVCVVGGVLTGIYVREFLAVRATGALLLLVAEVILESAFLRSDPGRLLMTVTAYAYVVIGCFLVGSPYLLRDALARIYKEPVRAKAAALGGVIFGVVLLVLGIFVY